MSWRFAHTQSESCIGGGPLIDVLAAGAYSATAAQARRPVRFIVPLPSLVTFLKRLAQPVAALAREIREHGQRLRLSWNNPPAWTDVASTKILIASPHTALNELLRGFEANGGLIAVQQGSCFVVVASVNSLPVGHRLELPDRAVSAGQERSFGTDEVVEHAGHHVESASQPEAYPDREFERIVEQALKVLSDYSVLGQSALVGQFRLEAASQIQQAKLLRGMLVEAIESLRPAGDPPIGVLPREWHAYTILHDAYIDDVPNRDIMSKLYISEGTFNRQRRKALRAVATAMWEVRQSQANGVVAEGDQGKRLVQARGQLARSNV
jgi:hypothetical protein